MNSLQAKDRKLGPAELIASCGMNCGVCSAYLRQRNPCPGCRAPDRGKPKTRRRCQIKTCRVRRENKLDFCAGCHRLPCEPLQRLDRRYRTQYGMSMLANLQTIATDGVAALVQRERARWICQGCGATLCVHTNACPECRKPWR